MTEHTEQQQAARAVACIEDLRQLAAEGLREGRNRVDATVSAAVLLERIEQYGDRPNRRPLHAKIDVPLGELKPLGTASTGAARVECVVASKHAEPWGEVTYQAHVHGTPAEALDLAFGLLVASAGRLGDARLREHVVAACSSIDRVLELVGHETQRCSWCGGLGERHYPRSGRRERCGRCRGTGRDTTWIPVSKRDAQEVS